MPPPPPKGRWVLVFDDHTPPAFWSIDRETLDRICVHLKDTCPTARVMWQEAAESSVANHVYASDAGEE